MKQHWVNLLFLTICFAIMAPASLLAQKEEKDKEMKEKKDVQQIIITRKNDKGDKIVVEINGDKITINGKPPDEYKDKNNDLTVRLQKFKELDALARNPGMRNNWTFNDNGDNLRFFSDDANHAMLGVTTEKMENGVSIQNVTKESGAEKAGLKEGDVITKIDDKKINDPDELSKIIREHKPGDKVKVSILRDKKEQTVTAELTKWKGINMFSSIPGFQMDLNDLNFDHIMPKTPVMPRGVKPPGQNWNWNWSGGSPKLGISVQDTDDGKGVKVIDVDEESNAAKAGIKEDDIITEVNEKSVNSTDEISKIIRESKEKNSVMIKLLRSGKALNIEVKIPRKIKTADL
ncbi:MAG: PDZ domain-containing protein [Chitinophagaceae bacterium]